MMPSHSKTESTGCAPPVATPTALAAPQLAISSALSMNASSTLTRHSSSVLESQAQPLRSHGPASISRSHSDGEPAVPFEVPHFSTVSLLTVWILDCAVGLFSLVLSDVYVNQYPEFPLMFFLALGSHLNVLAGFFVYLLGREKYGHKVYRLYQPFAGGVQFVTLQCFGVTCVSSSLLLTAAYGLLFEPSGNHSHGFMSTIGALALFGNILLLLSLRSFTYYDSVKASEPGSITALSGTGSAFLADKGISAFLRYLRRRPNAESALEVALLTAQSAFSMVAIRFPGLQEIILLVNLAITLACGALSLFFVGYRRSLGFISFRLWMHRTFDTVLLWLSRFLYVAAALANVLLLMDAGVHTVTPSSVLAVQGLSVVSCVALLMFLRTMRYEALANTPSVPSSVFELGGVVAVATAFLLACLNVSIFFYAQNYPDGLDEAVEGTSWTYQGVLVLVSQLAQLVSLLPTPMVYVSGAVMHDNQFRMLAKNRSVETLPVLLLQALSYLLYVAAIISFTLFLSSSAPPIASLEAVLSTLSVFCMTCAVRLCSSLTLKGRTFLAAIVEEPRSESATVGGKQAAKPVLNLDSVSPVHTSSSRDVRSGMAEELSHTAYIMNGGMIFSYLLCLTNLLLRLLVDISLHHVWGEVELPHARLMTIANACFIACVPLAHYSGKDKGVRVFHPFTGSGSFVALQVLGWMIYALFVIVIIFRTIVASNSKSIPAEWHALIEEGPVMYTLFGVLELIPVVLITLSIAVESRYTMATALQQRLAKESFLELRRFMREELARKSDEEKAVAQVAFRTLMTAALHSFDIPCTDSLLRIYKDSAAARRTGRGSRAEGSCSTGSDDEDGGAEGNESRESSDWSCSGEDLTIRRRRHEGARMLVFLLCCASAAFFVIAAFMAKVMVLSLAFAVTAMLICTISCVGVHAGYGMVLHGEPSVYVPFMPFRGGSQFVVRQMGGWCCYTGAFLVTLITSIESAEVSATAMLIAALLSVTSQVFIFSSVPLFSHRRGEPTFLEVNGEGIVALFTFSGAMVFGRVYTPLVAFFGRDTQHYLHYDDESSASHRTRVPFVLAVMSLSLAVPCTLIALSRTKLQWERVMHTGTAAEAISKQSPSFTRRERRRRMLTKGISNLIEVLVILFATVTPLSIGFLIFYFFTHYTPRLVHVMEAYLPVCFTLTALTLVLSVVPYVANVGVPPFVVTVRVTIVTWMLYCMPVLAGGVMLLPALIKPRHSTLFSACGALVLLMGGNFRTLRLAMRLAVYAVIGYLTYQRCMLHVAGGPSWVLARALGVHLVDCAVLGAWLWYLPLYSGKPYHTGSQRSLRFTELARNYLFADAVKYFNFRVIVDDPAVQMRDDTSQYLFSFHPHGVFPGTALFASLTAEWALKVGVNAQRYVSTHVASIVFNVPLLRDFNLRLGALSVSRRSVEASLKRGNSVLIVTGGQAEMLRTQVSSARMILITQHTGFIRLAIASRVPLVPLLCFAENNVLGMLQFPRIQRLSLRLLGFPFPVIPFGRFGLPLPFRTPLTLVVGPPLAIPEGADENNPDDMRRVSEAYFQSLRDLFYRRRAEAGYPGMELVLLNEKEEARMRKQARDAAAKKAA
ncbi:putative diacylglycerol acyltransferase [Leishmania mexicana MHOM/GT/2001/U1103]|uniref:Diacylglycerol acyltransferase n=1 Tax=Leishmania mexicana (strain MHOM/GT/2001/U1103) TaxID=929439 RepID=E9AZ60_LEIMU|nr:putative diacylglycerol acyltransferase [Leishmania mexicana MHOM/GT/2001/U1103]CBZ28257.1 putative diacylglycerol acyltransferase [Leishmania mexicana MHOM/GT/2001/U1103]